MHANEMKIMREKFFLCTFHHFHFPHKHDVEKKWFKVKYTHFSHHNENTSRLIMFKCNFARIKKIEKIIFALK